MKKILAISSIFLLSFSLALAQEVNKTVQQDKVSSKQKFEEKLEKASPEQRARMEKHRQIMEKLTPEKRKELKAEIQRHRGEVKRITGEEPPMMPPMEEPKN